MPPASPYSRCGQRIPWGSSNFTSRGLRRDRQWCLKDKEPIAFLLAREAHDLHLALHTLLPLRHYIYVYIIFQELRTCYPQHTLGHSDYFYTLDRQQMKDYHTGLPSVSEN
jgi:hypothetical protein